MYPNQFWAEAMAREREADLQRRLRGRLNSAPQHARGAVLLAGAGFFVR